MKNKYKFIDLTHTVDENSPFWEGGCGYSNHILVDYTDSFDSCRVQRLNMDAGIGTHIDLPAHFYRNAETADKTDINHFISDAIVIDVSYKADCDYIITVDDIKEFEKKCYVSFHDIFIFFFTGWSKYWGNKDVYINKYKFPSIHKDVANYLVKKKIKGIGIDTLSPDLINKAFPVHKILLNKGIYIIENVAHLDLLPSLGFYIFALPLKLKNITESPLRLIAAIKL